MRASTHPNESLSYFTEPGNGWIIPWTNHKGTEGHADALEAAKAAGFGPLVFNVVAVQCEECLKMLEPLAPTD